MPGVLNLTQPRDLLVKLEHEVQALLTDRSDSYAAINALRDAYHLREWVWHDRLEHDLTLLTTITGTGGNKDSWNCWVKQPFPDFEWLLQSAVCRH